MAKADLIYIQCERGFFTYHHYGIDIGDGTVVHLATEPEEGPTVCNQAFPDPKGSEMSVQRVSVEDFAKGATVSVEQVDKPLSPDVVVERAIAAVGKRGYHLVNANCEHFARLIKTGKSNSVQVDMCVRSIVRTAFSGFASTARRHVIACSLTAVTQSKFLVAAGSLLPTVVGETARQGAYIVARKLQMTHDEAEKSSRSVGHAACAVGGFVVGGPVGSAGALAISVAADRLTDSIQKRYPAQS